MLSNDWHFNRSNNKCIERFSKVVKKNQDTDHHAIDPSTRNNWIQSTNNNCKSYTIIFEIKYRYEMNYRKKNCCYLRKMGKRPVTIRQFVCQQYSYTSVIYVNNVTMSILNHCTPSRMKPPPKQKPTHIYKRIDLFLQSDNSVDLHYSLKCVVIWPLQQLLLSVSRYLLHCEINIKHKLWKSIGSNREALIWLMKVRHGKSNMNLKKTVWAIFPQ